MIVVGMFHGNWDSGQWNELKLLYNGYSWLPPVGKATMQYDSLSYPLSIWKASNVMVIFFWSIYVWNMTKGRLIGHSLYMGHYVRYCCRRNTWKFQSVLDRHLKFKFPHWADFPLSPTRPQQFHIIQAQVILDSIPYLIACLNVEAFIAKYMHELLTF